MDRLDGGTGREPLWRWTLVWIGFSVYGADAGREHGALGIGIGVVVGTLVTLACFGVVRLLSGLLADGPTTVPPPCLRECCEGYGEGDYEFLDRTEDGDSVRCGCGDLYHLSPDALFGAQKMFVLIDGAPQQVARKKVLGPWRWTISAEVQRHLVEQLRPRGASYS